MKKSKYWIINQKIYDFSNFKHPGGEKVLKLARDRFDDCTHVFESQHLDIDRCKKIISNYEIKENMSGTFGSTFCIDNLSIHPKFMSDDSNYYILKKKVSKYLDDINHKNGIPKKECLILYSIIMLLWIFLFIYTLLSGSYFISFIWGIVSAWLGAFGHNWIHIPKYRILATFSLDLVGLSSENWLHSHLLQHHIYTNTPKDNHYEGTEPFLITNPEKKRNWMQENIFPITSPILLCFGIYVNHIIDWINIFKCKEEISIGKFFIFLIFLIFNIKYTFYQSILLLFTCHATVGCYYFSIALMNHNTKKSLEDHSYKNWFEHQIDASVDWCTEYGFYKSIIFLWLNYHTVHHLFPKVDFSHHKEISKILYEMCPEKYVNQKSPISIYKEMIFCFRYPQRLKKN